ncbi:DNA polymerase III subunit gamma/tau [Candidatus Marinamargulisbacteria bacterium SCGC AG-333-B06]|nr:DNA polymerase III subunit gamma/tau [Candidatus Marinamargulisbacteria bacterium SCGC AG-333-B06]
MSRITFYRKYRSQHFSELVGQEHIVQTLTNAITNQRLSHAYIFSGPRGTGKTSVARIFAKAVNTYEKENQLENLANEVCERITIGNCVDVIEIDAASNTGVDNIRELKDNVNFSPVECSYKFYIIDEVHMLSTGAFNALLKTLEEPPSHTVFVLATTEPHKIPITIHSRCQHLRFRNLTDQEIKQQLLTIAEKESITLAEDAAAILARNASGCMRDGLSLLDQIYSFTGDAITSEDVNKILGSCNLDHLCQLLAAIYENDSALVLKLLTEVLKAGVNPLQFLKDIMFVSEQLLMEQSQCEEFVTINKEQLKQLTAKATLDKTVKLLDCLAQIESQTRWFLNPGLLLQIRLMQFVSPGESNDNNKSEPENKTALTQNQTKNPENKQETTSQAVAPKPINPIKQTPDIQNTDNPVPQHKTTSESAGRKHTISIPKPDEVKNQTNSLNKASISTNQHEGIIDIQKQWPEFLNVIKKEHLGLYTILRSSQVVGLENSEVVITLEQNIQFFIEKLTEETYQKALATYLQQQFNKPLTLKVTDKAQESIEIEMVSAVSQAVKITGEANGDVPKEITLPETNAEQSINDIVTLFEGKVL